MGLVFTLGFAGELSAQRSAPEPAGPNTLIGVVTDTMGVALADVDITIAKSPRRTRTRSDGSFRFDSLSVGSYDLSARRIGFIAPSTRAVVGANGGAVVISMIRIGNVLPSMVTIASRGGLSGVIADTALRAIRDVSVTAIGGAHSAKTDATGAFFMPLKPGRYLIRLDRDGFARQTIGVTIPETEGRNIAAWLSPQVGGKLHLESQRLFDLNQRMSRVSPASSRFYTREDLNEQGIPDLLALVHRWSTGKITDECMVKINGTTVEVPIGALSSSDVEFIELYLPTKIGSVRGGTSINRNNTKFVARTFQQPGASPYCGNVTLMAWLRN